MRNRLIVFLVAVAAGAQAQLNTAAPEKGLFRIGLTTERQRSESRDGAFTASILAHSGLVSVLYNCQANVASTASAWAKKQQLRLSEQKSEANHLRLAYASGSPPGFFILDYSVSPKLDRATLTFAFRTLSNVQVSGDQMGLEPLGQKLLEAVQCVPRR